MTTIKDAPLKPCPFCAAEAESDSQRGYRNISTGNLENAAAIYCTSCNADMTWCYRDTPEIEREQVMTLLAEQWNTRAITAHPDREKVARIIDPSAWRDQGYKHAEWRIEQSLKKADEIIAAGLASDEPPKALNETEIRAGINILLETIAKKFEANDTFDIWRSEAADMVRSYKHADAVDGAEIRADEREKCAAEVERRNWPTVGDARRIAAAIRSAGRAALKGQSDDR